MNHSRHLKTPQRSSGFLQFRGEQIKEEKKEEHTGGVIYTLSENNRYRVHELILLLQIHVLWPQQFVETLQVKVTTQMSLSSNVNWTRKSTSILQWTEEKTQPQVQSNFGFICLCQACWVSRHVLVSESTFEASLKRSHSQTNSEQVVRYTNYFKGDAYFPFYIFLLQGGWRVSLFGSRILWRKGRSMFVCLILKERLRVKIRKEGMREETPTICVTEC